MIAMWQMAKSKIKQNWTNAESTNINQMKLWMCLLGLQNIQHKAANARKTETTIAYQRRQKINDYINQLKFILRSVFVCPCLKKPKILEIHPCVFATNHT